MSKDQKEKSEEQNSQKNVDLSKKASSSEEKVSSVKKETTVSGKLKSQDSTEVKQESSSKEVKAEASTEKPPANSFKEAKSFEESKLEESSKKEKESSSKEEKTSKERKVTASEKKDESIQLAGLFAFKMEMAAFYDEKGSRIPVTALKYEPWKISQIKTKEKEGYSAIQLACFPQKNKRCSRALVKHLSPAGFKEGARYVKEIRQTLPEGIKVGQTVSIESLKKGDLVKLSSRSKGRGFAGVMKKWNFAGGKASHGSKSHRRIGSIGQHTEPARVMPGRKMPGRYGFKQVSRRSIQIFDVLPEEGMIFVKGSVPGARNTLVRLQKMESLNA